MASFGRQYTNSPVLTMSPQAFIQTPLPMASFPRNHNPSRPFGTDLFQGITATPQRTAGRKRSRDEAAANLESDAPAPQPIVSEHKWTLGEGMTLVKPDTKYVAIASSQSGTWLEEKSASDQEETRQRFTDHLQPRNSKSQRMDPTVGEIAAPPATFSTASQADTLLTPSPTGSSDMPVVDDFTLHLGIGWRRISSDEHIQAASRGWARYIENHYPLTNVRVCLESKGLQSYLVESAEGFFLFAENLRQGRLISFTVQKTLANLQQRPPVFEGADTLHASESPHPTASAFFTQTVDSEMSLC